MADILNDGCVEMRGGSVKPSHTLYGQPHPDSVSPDQRVIISIMLLTPKLEEERSDPIFFKLKEEKAVNDLFPEIIQNLKEQDEYCDPVQNTGRAILLEVYGKDLEFVYRKLADEGYPEFVRIMENMENEDPCKYCGSPTSFMADPYVCRDCYPNLFK